MCGIITRRKILKYVMKQSLPNSLASLIDSAETQGLPAQDLTNAQSFLDHIEFGLCFDTIITQIYEYEIEITSEFYDSIIVIADQMKLPVESYSFMKERIKKEL